MKYAVIYEPTKTGFSAYVPDLPGCIGTGRDFETTQKRMEKAIDMHIAGVRADGDAIPEPKTTARYVTVQRYSRRKRSPSAGHTTQSSRRGKSNGGFVTTAPAKSPTEAKTPHGA